MLGSTSSWYHEESRISILYPANVHTLKDAHVRVYGYQPRTEKRVYATNVLYKDMVDLAYEGGDLIVTDDRDSDLELRVPAHVMRGFIGAMVRTAHINQLMRTSDEDYYRHHVYRQWAARHRKEPEPIDF